jgi:dienelactone hydrolase
MTQSRAKLKALLGPWSDERPRAAVRQRRREETSAAIVEHIDFDLGTGASIPAVLVRPHGEGRRPAILYCHAHGGRYEIGAGELLHGRPSLISPYGPPLAAAGFIALCVEMPTFGARREPGESALAKALLWRGETLFGRMLGELAIGLDHLCSRPDVDSARIASFGISMGATHAYWLAALDERIARTAHLCCYADLQSLIETGAHDLHGIYMTVPGLAASLSTGAIAGLVAPRPQLICVGYDDPLTPKPAVERAFRETEAAYRAAGANAALTFHGEPGVGHRETPAMREAILRFLGQLRR